MCFGCAPCSSHVIRNEDVYSYIIFHHILFYFVFFVFYFNLLAMVLIGIDQKILIIFTQFSIICWISFCFLYLLSNAQHEHIFLEWIYYNFSFFFQALHATVAKGYKLIVFQNLYKFRFGFPKSTHRYIFMTEFI